ncbi:uncharacterized protein LOC143658905 isoform X2 [Tamandua tetradactyla]|uniref:uncharacterized protein LOC143658905 isoform X2 n=1 Tax=Tamandua tetradactyla TaxID=48850 RepID=UPI0040549055
MLGVLVGSDAGQDGGNLERGDTEQCAQTRSHHCLEQNALHRLPTAPLGKTLTAARKAALSALMSYQRDSDRKQRNTTDPSAESVFTPKSQKVARR